MICSRETLISMASTMISVNIRSKRTTCSRQMSIRHHMIDTSCSLLGTSNFLILVVEWTVHGHQHVECVSTSDSREKQDDRQQGRVAAARQLAALLQLSGKAPPCKKTITRAL